MAIAKKPKPSNKPSEKNEVDIDALINKGGSVAQIKQAEEVTNTNTGLPSPAKQNSSLSKPSPKATDNQEIRVNLRLSPDLLEQVDQAVKARPFKTPRHTWLLEAVMEKLEREEHS